MDLRFPLTALAILGAIGCHNAAPVEVKEEPAAEAKDAGAPKEAKEEKSELSKLKAGDAKTRKFAVPFAWEASQDEPLAQTRAFLTEALSQNDTYVTGHDSRFFTSLLAVQKPRATVITCTDSRVQTPAFDATPENDAFIVRDFGNQMGTAAGSVEYGVHDLHTPLLLVLGHTGCAAVKAAMGNFDHEPAAVKSELETIAVPKAKEKDDGDESAEKTDKHEFKKSKLVKSGDDAKDAKDAKGDAKKDEPRKPSQEDIALAQAVVFNVHAQVASAVTKFAEEIEAGNLTVVGAVLDVHDDMGRGAGKLIVVDVNGHSDASTVNAFERALTGSAHAMVVPGDNVAATAPASTAARPATTVAHREEIREALRQLTRIDGNSPDSTAPAASGRPNAIAPQSARSH